MITAEIVARIKAQAPALGARVFGALEFAELLNKGALPQRMPAAYVLPLGRDPGEPSAMANAFRQPCQSSFGVVLFLTRSGDVMGNKSVGDVETLEEQLIAQLCGWQPASADGPMELKTTRLLGLEAGAVQWQVDFAVREDVRIVT